MVSITLSVPEETRRLMKEFPDVNWSGLVRACILDKARNLEMKRALLEKLGSKKEKNFNDWAVGVVREGRRKK